jgi:hypothetical protein
MQISTINDREESMRAGNFTNGCQLVTLAHGPLLRVDRCLDCGTITLHLGALSLRLDRTAAESLWTTLGHGLVAQREAAHGSEGEERFAH